MVVSGGHTSLFYVKSFSKIELLGSTQDDACGEAFDKVATILGLSYPGGPIIEKMARNGNKRKIRFKCSNTKEPLNFSFSGIKTAVLYYAQKELKLNKPQCVRKGNWGMGIRRRGLVSDVAASFQAAVIEALVKKSLLACKLKKVRHLVVGGGVAANSYLRERLIQAAYNNNLKVYLSAKELCVDNAAMVAGLGYQMRPQLAGFKR